MDTTIDAEVEKHTAQLKKELQPKISAAKKEITTYTEQQKQQGIDELQSYVDQLLDQKSTVPAIDKEQYSRELQQIIERAKKQMDYVQPQKSKESDASAGDEKKPTAKDAIDSKERMSNRDAVGVDPLENDTDHE